MGLPSPFDQETLSRIFGRHEAFDAMSIAQTIRTDTRARAVLLIINGEDFSSGQIPIDLTVENATEMAYTRQPSTDNTTGRTVPDSEGYRTLWARDGIILVVAHEEFPPSDRLQRMASATVVSLAEQH